MQMLIGTMILPDKGVLVTNRFLENHDKMVYTLQLKSEGKNIGPIKRIFNRKKQEK